MEDIRKPIPVLWYESETGEKKLPDYDAATPTISDGYPYQRSQFPLEVHDACILREPDGGCKEIAHGRCGYSAALVLALTRPTWSERLRQLLRGHWMPTVDLSQAILLAATSCERCSNVLHWRCGTRFGYELHSKKWRKARTRCERCEDEANLVSE